MKGKTIKRTVLLTLLTIAAALTLIFCDQPKVLSDTEAEDMAGEVMTAFNAAVSNALSSAAYAGRSVNRSVATENPAPRAATSVTYSAGGIRVTGNFDLDYTSGSVEYDFTVTFSDYESGGLVLDGSSTYEISVSGMDVSGSFEGSFDIEMDGAEYDFRWDFTVSDTTVTGSYYINDISYSYYDGDGYSSPDTGYGDDDTGDEDPTPTTGKICFWTSVGTHGDIYIYLNSSYAGVLTQYFASGTPVFGQSGTITVTKSPGTHTLYAESEDEEIYWDDYITVLAGQELLWELR